MWTYDGSGESEVGTLRLRVLDEGEKCFREDDEGDNSCESR